uniref:Retroelement silencing factor 1 n=1 Tax=Myotis lucifugus TaxID=59463 RepID=G1Q9R0_MYOLU
MDWNAKPNSVTLQPMYPKKQSSFLEPSVINTPSQVPLNPPGSNHPACMFRSNSNPVSQSPLNIRNTTSHQISASDIHSRTIFASQVSLERKTYANVKGPSQLNNSLQMSPGVAQNVWTNSPGRNSMFSHTGAAVSQQTGFRTNPPNVNALQNQFVTSEVYSMQGQMVPSNPVRVPVTYQGNQRLTSSLSERQADCAQQYTSNGLTYADYRPRPEQYSYPPQSYLQIQVKNSHHSNSALTLQSKQAASLPSYQIAVIQNENRLLPPYDCRYASQTLQNSQHVITHSSEVPQSQEVHTSEMRKDFCRGLQQQNLNENVSMTGNFCNMKVNTSTNQSFSEPIRSVDDVQILPQNNQEERVDFSNLTPSQVLDTNIAKEKLVKDIKQLVEMRKKFSELARKIKINKNVLMLAGCIKNINANVSENSSCMDHKFPKTGAPLNADSHLELLATCLNLWKKTPSEPTEKKQCNELTAQRTAVRISKAGEICDKTPVSLVGNSQNKMENCSQVTTLPMVVQSYESPGATTIKGTELQIAVVSPLISDIKTLPVKGITPDLPETGYPVIKEGSVCSLQNQLAENRRVTAVLKVNEPVTSTTNKVLPLIQKEKRNTSTNGNSEDAQSEPNIHCPVSDQQASSNSRDDDTVSSELLQIDNICSLVEGDTSYNYQIAKIFKSPPIEQIESQKSLPSLQVISTKKQKEQSDNITEKIELGLQKDNFLQYTDVLHKKPDQSKSPQPLESFLKNVDSSSENPEESNLKHYSKKVSTAKDMCSSAALHQSSNPQEIDVSCNHTAQDPAVNEVLDDTSIFFPHDQLSELSKDFPYGIEPVTTHEDSPAKQITDKNSKDESCDKTICDSKDATDHIKITILNSEQMKELFPEQNDQSCELDKFTKSEKENPVTKKGIHCDSPVHTDGESSNFVMDSEKDDVRCCALGWLSNVYEGVPQCQCKSINNLTSKVENGKDRCSLETNSCKQGETTSDKDYSMLFNCSPNNNPKIAMTVPIGKNPFSETEQGKTMKDLSEPKCSSLRTEQELSAPSFSKGDKKLDSLKCHKKKRKLKFHEMTFHSSAKRKFSQESLQRKIIAQNSSPPKGKPGFWTNKNKDLHIKNGSLVQKLLPEKIKLKTGDHQQKVSAKRKLGEGSILNSEVKKMKYFKQEQNKNGDGTLKTCSLLSKPDDRAKEKTVSNVKSLGSTSKDNSPKVVITLEQYLQRQKHKEAMGVKASKLNCEKSIPCDSQSMRSSKLAMQIGSSGKSNERHSSSVQTSEESLSIYSSHDKNTKIHHSHVSKSYLLGNAKETVGGKQPDKMLIDKTKLDKNLNNINNGGERNHLSPQAKEQRKQYLNRVAFKCIERESICLTKLDSLPKNIEKSVENKPNTTLPKKNTTEKQSMLEFKLCPDGLINKKINSTEEQKDLQPCPRKEQAPVQVTGIKSSKEDWIKGAPEEKRIPEANQEIDDNVLANSRNTNRTFSADGLETLKNPVKDSKAIFQAYQKLYLEKRSKSLGSSPLK